MAKRIMISFAIEDKWARDYLVGQAKNEAVPFEFVDMSVKEPWDEKWKTNCRTRIRGCHGLIAIVTKNTAKADGQLWEIKCAREEKIPMIGVYAKADDKPASLPADLANVKIIDWTWSGIKSFIDKV
ncbi:MAG: hypothetical protein JNL71_03300 [Rhodospirillales bacterium]|nr:hypothetical protein [Rhodospirillales bacterium]